MSQKRKYIETANLLLEQRYLATKYLAEAEDPNKQQTNISNMGVNVNDKSTQQAVLDQLQQYSNKIDLEKLKPFVGTQNFFSKLSEVVTLEPDISKMDNKTITGEELKLELPGGIKLKGTFDMGRGGKITGLGDVGVSKNLNVGNTQVNLGVKYKDPTSGLNASNVQVGAKVNIPQTTKNKSHGLRL